MKTRKKRYLIAVFAAVFFLLTGCAETQVMKENMEARPPVSVEEAEPAEQEASEQADNPENLEAESPDGHTGEENLGILTVEIIDVGQGDSILIITPDNKSILIDSGDRGKADIVMERLRAHNVERLDIAVATHPHADHIGSMAEIVKAYSPESFYMPDAISTTKTFENLLYALQDEGITVDIAGKGISIPVSDVLTMEFISPDRDWDDLNNMSAVLKMTYGKTGFLFTGDMEKDAESLLEGNLDIDVLKVGHHGSDTSTSDELIRKTTPSISVISVGEGNRYGHPKSTVIERLQSAGSKVYRTDQTGLVAIYSDGKNVWLSDTAEESEKEDSSMVILEEKNPIPTDSDGERVVYKTKTGSKYHLDGCSALKSRIETTVSEAEADGLEPCGLCRP